MPGADGGSVQIEAPDGIPTGSQFTIGNIASVFISSAMVVGIFLSLAYLIYGGFLWLQAGGNKQSLDKARRTIVFAIFGLVIMSLALVIVNVIASALGARTAINP